MSTENLEIKYLSENPQFTETVSDWIYNEFMKDVRHDLTIEDLTAQIKVCHKETLPVRLVALQNGQCVGTVSLVENDLKCRDYTPWLAALIVRGDLRGSGIGQQLVSFVQGLARQMGYRELYLRTEHASAYYKKLGWQYVETCEDLYDLKPDVFKVTL